MSDQLSSILNGEPELLASGFGFTEGPVWHPDSYLYFSDIPNNHLLKWVPGQSPYVAMDGTQGGNGLTFDKQGRLLMCQMAARRVVRFDGEGAMTVVADRWEGKRLTAPNDVVGRSDGTIFFTDPGGRVPMEDREIKFAGVYTVSPGRQDGPGHRRVRVSQRPGLLPRRVHPVRGHKPQEPGLSRRREQRGDMCPHRRIRAFDVAADGSLSNNRVFADMSSALEGVPDGMKVDMDGRVWCTGNGGTQIYDKDGNHVGDLRTGEVPANCAWGGSDNRTLFLTARTSVYTVRVNTPGTAHPPGPLDGPVYNHVHHGRLAQGEGLVQRRPQLRRVLHRTAVDAEPPGHAGHVQGQGEVHTQVLAPAVLVLEHVP